MEVPGSYTPHIMTVAEMDTLGHVFTSGTRPSGVEVYEGRRIYETDTSMWQSYDGSAWSPIGPVDGALTDWTPTIDQGANTNIAKSSTYAKYSRVGRQVHASFRVVLSGAGASGTVLISLPVAAAATSNITDIGTFVWISSTAFYYANIAVIGVTANRFQGVMTSADTNAYFSAGGGMAVGSILTGQLSYEAAS